MNLRYVDIAQTFRVLCDLYVTSQSDEDRRRILQSVEVLARNDINVWRQVGFMVQKVIYDGIFLLPEAEKKLLRPVILAACRLFLDTELEGTTWHFDSVSLQRGTVPTSTAYGDFRRDSIEMLFDIYRHAEFLDEKFEVVRALGAATRFPMDGGADDLTKLILENSRQVVEFFSDRVATEPFEIIQHLEHQFLWLYRRSKEMTAPEPQTAVSAQASAVVMAIEQFRDHANSNVRYVRFKTLVGYDSVFPPEWDGDPMDIEGPQAYRSARIAEYVASISNETAEEWYDLVELCAAVKSNDLATFPSFAEFLKQLSTRTPAIATGWLHRSEQLSSRFLPAILDGLGRSAERAGTLSLVSGWIDEGRHLPEIARYLRFAEDNPLDLVTKAGQRAISLRDAVAVIEIIAVIIARRVESLVESVFAPALRLLTELNDTRWADATWFMPSLPPFLHGLSQQHCQIILENLILRQRVDFHVEKILQAIATERPRSVWCFFKARMDREERSGKYEAVPYGMQELRKPLAQDARLAIDIVRSWYSPDDHLFTYTGGRLLHDVFPQVTNELEATLLRLVRVSCKDDINFVLSILRSYEGGRLLHGVCKELVDVLPEADERVDQVVIVLDSTGVISGEFGMVQAYERKKQEVEDWLNDPRPKVRSFAEKYQRAIAAEQRRSEADYELRRRNWPEE
jgi:hypothetical protein